MNFRILIAIPLYFLQAFLLPAYGKSPKSEFYEIRIYNLENAEQEKRIDDYLKNALLPALHRNKIKKIGVFKPIGNDTAINKRVYLLIPFKSVKQFTELQNVLKKDKAYNIDGKVYIEAAYNQPPYKRIESTLLRAFSSAPVLQVPVLNGEKSQRIYELRSYESPTEKLYLNKVHMFNEGGETAIFKQLGFNPVFYGEVILGNRMPNLMYMTSFENKASRDALWKKFGESPEWKKLSSIPFYKNNMNKSEKIFLNPTAYSDI